MWWKRIASFLLGIALLGVPAAPVVMAGTTYSVSGNLIAVSGPNAWAGASIRWFDKSPRLAAIAHPSYFVLVPGPDGKATLTLEALSTTPVAAVEIAIDTISLNQMIAVGPTTSTAPGSNSTDSSAGSAVQASALSNASALSSYRSGRFYTEWDDPLYVPVSSVQDNVNWYYNGSQVTSFTGSDYRTWFSANGWHETYHNISAFYDSAHTKGTVRTYDTMLTSNWFPLPWCGTSTIYYSPSDVYGWADGHVSGTVTTWVNSGCAFLLGWSAGAGYN